MENITISDSTWDLLHSWLSAKKATGVAVRINTHERRHSNYDFELLFGKADTDGHAIVNDNHTVYIHAMSYPFMGGTELIWDKKLGQAGRFTFISTMADKFRDEQS